MLGKKIRIKTKFKIAEKSQSPHVEESFEKKLEARFSWDKKERINNLIQFMLSYKTDMEFEGRDFNADKVKLFEPVRHKMAKIYLHDLSSFGPPNLEIYHFMERDDNSLDEIELEEKSNWVRDRKYIKT